MSAKNDTLGDRMKSYEAVYKRPMTPRSSVIVRVDGQVFRTYTRGFDRPFDNRIITAMEYAAGVTSTQMCGFKLAYVQSDEASFLLTDFDTHRTKAWFKNECGKISSVAASWMTAAFNDIMGQIKDTPVGKGKKLATFDGRCFVIPHDDVANYFLWRAKDWLRNSLSMYTRAHFSTKQMHGKRRADQHEMLHGVGKNWAKDLTPQQRNGTYITRGPGGNLFHYDVQPTYLDCDSMVKSVLPNADLGAKEKGA
jgi:tRNA(His) guanylyltransferase